MTVSELRKKANYIRQELLTMIYHSGAGHTGGALSSTDMMTALFYGVMKVSPERPSDPNRDHFILSKGHCVEPYYCILADLGFIPKEELKTFHQFGTRLIGHPNGKVPGVEIGTGALGHGLSVGVGTAIGNQYQKKSNRTYVIMGDGEQAEGSVWEAAMAAGHYKLDNLCGVIDRNGLQISGKTEEIMSLDCLEDKWTSFGWQVHQCDGNSMEELMAAFDTMKTVKNKPGLLIANTVKGKGVSFMEHQASWHHGVPTDQQFEQAMEELAAERSSL